MLMVVDDKYPLYTILPRLHFFTPFTLYPIYTVLFYPLYTVLPALHFFTPFTLYPVYTETERTFFGFSIAPGNVIVMSTGYFLKKVRISTLEGHNS